MHFFTPNLKVLPGMGELAGLDELAGLAGFAGLAGLYYHFLHRVMPTGEWPQTSQARIIISLYSYIIILL